MKKGLLSILAGALLVVGCQNYDDQFSSLESQINALASTVAGLSQVQSDLSALSGTVSSLSSTVASLGSSIDTAVSNGLADITADIASLQAAVADVASSADVDAIATALAAAQSDLDDLLASSSVFNDNVVVNSSSSLDAFLAMGTGLNIVNGNVTITTNSTMDATKVQSLVDNILTITKDLTFTGASTEAVPTFKNLTGVQSITISGAGDYRFDNLQSAGIIKLNNDSAKTTIVHFGSLTSYTSISDDAGTANVVSMPNAKEFHLTSLGVLPNSALTLTIDEGGVFAHGLTGKKADGTDDTITLSLNGPKSVTLSTIVDGTITAANVETLSISGFRGATDINGGVENVTLNGAVGSTSGTVVDIAGGVDLVTLNVTGALDSDPTLSTADTTGPSVTVTSAHKDLTDITLAGVLGAVSISEAPKVATFAITADLNGAALTLDDLDDLSSITTKGAKIGNVTFQDNDEITVAEFAHTTETSAATVLGVTVSVTGNTNLETFHFFADDVKSLTLKTNAKLSKIDFTGLKDLGGATTATVLVSGNKLSASAVADAYDADTTVADTGKYTSTSGMSTLKTYLTAALAATGAKNIGVYFDTLEGVTQQLTSVSTPYTDVNDHTNATTGTGRNAVAYSVTTAATGKNVYQTVTTVFPLNRTLSSIDKNLSGEGITLTNALGSYDVLAPTDGHTAAQLVAALNGEGNTAMGSGTTVTAALDSYNEAVYTISWTVSTTGVAATSSSTTVSDTVYFTYGTDPTTGQPIRGTTAAITQMGSNVDHNDIAAAIADRINQLTSAFVATSTNNTITIGATVSGTTHRDVGPLSHALQTLQIVDTALAASQTLLWAGSNAAHVVAASAASNTTASASSLYNLAIAKEDRSGLRVTLQNTSTTVADASLAAAEKATGDAMTGVGVILAAGTNIIGSGTNSNTLNYTAGFSDIETQTPASTSTANRVSWLG